LLLAVFENVEGQFCVEGRTPITHDLSQQEVNDDFTPPVLPGEMKIFPQKIGQHGHAPVARCALENDEQQEYKNRYKHYHFIFHNAFFSEKLKCRAEFILLAVKNIHFACPHIQRPPLPQSPI
jgi:hypothetical protein